MEETLAIADQMTDPECKRLLIGVAETYAQLARHAAANETAIVPLCPHAPSRQG